MANLQVCQPARKISLGAEQVLVCRLKGVHFGPEFGQHGLDGLGKRRAVLFDHLLADG